MRGRRIIRRVFLAYKRSKAIERGLVVAVVAGIVAVVALVVGAALTSTFARIGAALGQGG